MSKYFTLTELTRSDTVNKLNSDSITSNDIDNTPPASARANLELLATQLLDPVREMWGGPLRVNSGYRCAALNKAVGGSATSQHMAGQAADITTGSVLGNKQLFDMIRSSTLMWDQLIDESNFTWLHLSYRDGYNRKQILSL